MVGTPRGWVFRRCPVLCSAASQTALSREAQGIEAADAASILGAVDTRLKAELQTGRPSLERFWHVYDEAFRKFRMLAPCRQYLLEEEFVEKMRDERVTKFVLWDDAAAPVGLALVATDLSAVPWISPEFYAGLFPEHFRRRTIYYFAALLVAEATQRMRYSYVLLNTLEDFVIENDGVACFDCADATDGFLPALIKVTTEQRGFVECQKLGQQHYYAYVTRGFRPGHAPGGKADARGRTC